MERGSLVYFRTTTEKVWASDLGQPEVRVVLAWGGCTW